MEQSYEPKVLSDFKYYKGKGTINDNPFPCEDIRSRFWHGECMLANLLEQCGSEDEENAKISVWAADVTRWRSLLKKHKTNQSARFLRDNTDRQLAIALYIVTLWGKWCPHEGEDFIFDY